MGSKTSLTQAATVLQPSYICPKATADGLGGGYVVNWAGSEENTCCQAGGVIRDSAAA